MQEKKSQFVFNLFSICKILSFAMKKDIYVNGDRIKMPSVVLFNWLFSFDKKDNFNEAQASTVSKILSGKNKYPSCFHKLMSKVTNDDFSSLNSIYINGLCQIIDKEKIGKVVSSILELMKMDKTIDENDVIYKTNEIKLTKAELLARKEFSFPNDFTPLLFYLIRNDERRVKNNEKINNSPYSNQLQALFDKSDDSKVNVSMETSISLNGLIVKTAKYGSLSRAFRKIDNDLHLPEPFARDNKISLYIINVKNSQYDFSSLASFLGDVVEGFIFSREKVKEYYDSPIKIRHLVDDAKASVKKSGYPDKEVFSQLMLYSFLECAMEAPKIVNMIEDANFEKSSADGLYFVPEDSIKKNKPSLLLGTSSIDDNLDKAISNAIKDADECIESQENGSYTLDENIFNTHFPNDIAEKIINTIKNGESLFDNDISLGFFISFSLKVDKPKSSFKSSEEYRAHIMSLLEETIKSKIKWLYDTILKTKLSNYRLYFFFVPLDSVDEDVKQIMEVFYGK